MDRWQGNITKDSVFLKDGGDIKGGQEGVEAAIPKGRSRMLQLGGERRWHFSR